jgi:hypothetical protein
MHRQTTWRYACLYSATFKLQLWIMTLDYNCNLCITVADTFNCNLWVYKIGIEAYTHSMETYMLKIQQLILLQVWVMIISYECNSSKTVAVALPSLKLIFTNLFYECKE